jgi:hypothetical protein
MNLTLFDLVLFLLLVSFCCFGKRTAHAKNIYLDHATCQLKSLSTIKKSNPSMKKRGPSVKKSNFSVKKILFFTPSSVWKSRFVKESLFLCSYLTFVLAPRKMFLIRNQTSLVTCSFVTEQGLIRFFTFPRSDLSLTTTHLPSALKYD